MKFTILGSSGFIGTHLANYLKQQSINCFTPSKEYVLSKNENLGHLVYCIGLTADFRQKPMETIKSHVCKLIEILENATFETFLYLSSTRVYLGSNSGNEWDKITVEPTDPNYLYNISKLMGESICLSIPKPTVRVVRISNVIGFDFNSDNLLYFLIKESFDKKNIILRQSIKSTKDYVSIDDVTKMITLISQKGRCRLYNIASGFCLSHEQLINEIRKQIPCDVEVNENAPELTYPEISIERIKNEFSFIPKNILHDMQSLIKQYKEEKINDTN